MLLIMNNGFKFISKSRAVLYKLEVSCRSIGYYSRPALFFSHSDQKIYKKELAIGVIVFNNPEVIKQQIRLLKKYLKDDFDYYVFDNSNNELASLKIKEICNKQNILYLKLPPNPDYKGIVGRSHGYALNWSYYNYFKEKYRYFGLLDHDVFPIRITSVLEKLKIDGLWGLKHIRDSRWYIWPGFCFFDMEYINNAKLDFLPWSDLDTGGANWKTVYLLKPPISDLPFSCAKINDLLANQYLNWPNIMIPKSEYRLLNAKLLETDDLVEFFGDWIHFFNASNWRGLEHPKTYKIEQVLKKI